jgi:hypothetical protein
MYCVVAVIVLRTILVKNLKSLSSEGNSNRDNEINLELFKSTLS